MKKIIIVNSAEPGITEFVQPIEKIIEDTGSRSVVIEYKDCNHFNFDEYDGVILSGSPQGDDIVEHHLPFFQWIRNFDKPVLGICAGHHVIGFMYGSTLLRSVEPESGDVRVKVIKEDALFRGMANSFKVKQMHNDSITLPANFELLATSKTCMNQMMKHQEKPLYTCQFHPEFYNHDIIRNFIAITI